METKAPNKKATLKSGFSTARNQVSSIVENFNTDLSVDSVLKWTYLNYSLECCKYRNLTMLFYIVSENKKALQ